MRVSSGYRDIYEHFLPFQWVDVSEIQPGAYEVRSEIDPEGFIQESDEVNPYTAVEVPIPGIRAVAGSVAGAPPNNATSVIPLEARAFRLTSGEAQVRIETPPARGTLDAPVGTWVDAEEVRYTPDAGVTSTESDVFTFSARDAGAVFPRVPAPASVTVAFGDAQAPLAVDGPSQLVVGTSAQLAGPAGARWDVDGTPGGDAWVGTVTPGGLYTAPAQVPAGETVVVPRHHIRRPHRDEDRAHPAGAAATPAPTPNDPAFFVPVIPPVTTPATIVPPVGSAAKPTIRRLKLTRRGNFVGGGSCPAVMAG